MIDFEHDPHLMDFDARATAMIDLIQHPMRWASEIYISDMAIGLAAKCYQVNREDLGRLICEAVACRS